MQLEAIIWQKQQLCTFYYPPSISLKNGADSFRMEGIFARCRRFRNKTIWRHYQRANFMLDLPVMVYRLEEKSELNGYIHLKRLRSFWFKAKADGCVLQITTQRSLLSMKGIRLDAFVKQRFSQEYGPPRKKEVFVKQREKMTQKQVKGMKVEYVMPAVGQPCTTKDTVSIGSNISLIPYRYIEMLFVV